jgi:hypothetical protein
VFESEFRLDDGRWFREIDRATDDGGRVHVLIDITGLKETTRRLEEVVEGARVGTGLDLPLIATIVSEIGGGVAVRTRLGEGTTFYVCWPIREEDDIHPDMRPVVRSIYGGDDHLTPPSRSGKKPHPLAPDTT